MGKVKGTALQTAYDYYSKLGGKEAVDQAIATLDAPVRERLFGRKILAISWYDYGEYMKFLFAANKLIGKDDPKKLYEMGAYQAREYFNGFYKIFIRIATPEFVLKKAAQLWRLSYDSGEVTIVKSGKDYLDFRVDKFPDIPLQHELEQLPFFEETLRICNCREAKGTHTKCVARGDDCCFYELRWKS